MCHGLQGKWSLTKEDRAFGVTTVKGQKIFEHHQAELIVKSGQNKRKMESAYGRTACVVLGQEAFIPMCKRKGC